MSRTRTISLTVAMSVTAIALAGACATDDRQRDTLGDTDNLKAFEAFRSGWQHFRRFTVEDTSDAIVDLNRAVALDPKYGNAYAALAFTYLWAKRFGWSGALGLSGRPGEAGQEEIVLAKEHGPTPLLYQFDSWWYADQHDYESASADARRAIALDPNDPEGFITLAHALLHGGRPAAAAEAVETAMRLDPDYPSRYRYWLGFAKFHLEEFDEAATLLAEDVERNPHGTAEGCYSIFFFQCLSSIIPLVAAYGHLGRDEDARTAIAAWLKRAEGRSEMAPTLSRARLHWDHFRHSGYLERLLEGLRKAGLPPTDKDPSIDMTRGFAAGSGYQGTTGAPVKSPNADL